MGKEIAVEEAEPLPPTTEEAAVVEAEEAPEWLRVLLLTSFWGQCPEHWEASRAEVCLFCIVCHEVVCPHCTHDEPGHRLLKVRRYIYRSVVLAKDMQDLNVDVSRVQSYIINGQKGVHLRPMRRSAQFKPPTRTPRCLTCLCWLRSAPNEFCSLACKVDLDVSQDDFSGPEAERRHKHVQGHLSEAAPHQPVQPNVEGPFEALLEAVQQEDVVMVNVPELESLAVGGGGDKSSSDAHSFRRRPRKQAEPQRAPFF
ncbi:hypothetical protein GUJ93_ZPchr0013g36089 [Zizania palustris]|uniref:B box-type domain-containing protein n=1 Tax=Zizania palustris TaxID=103762 RepID=A0A8J6BY45_ZIZPA|nr:hypothetical protein GUJ93_ZPchr0013g36089 [Zizania palustris]